MSKIEFEAIGEIHSPFKEAKGTPIQPPAAKGVEGEIELLAKYQQGLKDLSDFSHIILLYHFHLAKEPSLTATPFMEDEEHGIFAIRAPSRPNSIGLSIVRLVDIKDNIIKIKDVDILDGTPLLDIKPYVAGFDQRENVTSGWLEKNIDKLADKKDDGRFLEE